MTNELLLRSKRVGSLQHSFLEVCSTASWMCETFFKLILQKENFSGFLWLCIEIGGIFACYIAFNNRKIGTCLTILISLHLKQIAACTIVQWNMSHLRIINQSHSLNWSILINLYFPTIIISIINANIFLNYCVKLLFYFFLLNLTLTFREKY